MLPYLFLVLRHCSPNKQAGGNESDLALDLLARLVRPGVDLLKEKSRKISCKIGKPVRTGLNDPNQLGAATTSVHFFSVRKNTSSAFKG